MTRTPRRSRVRRWVYSRYAARCRAATVLPHALQAGPDHAVLFGLDGGHHVGHPAGTAGGDAGDQHGLAGQRPAVRLGHRIQVENLIVDSGDGSVPGVDVTAPDQAVRVLGGGGVERVRGRRPPVDQLGLVLVVAQPDPADVQRGRGPVRGAGLVAVGAAEDQAGLHRVELGQPPALFGRGDITLDPGLERPARAAAAVGDRQRLRGPAAGGIQQAVKHIDVGLLLADGTFSTRGD
jgi:hypothetical protein